MHPFRLLVFLWLFIAVAARYSFSSCPFTLMLAFTFNLLCVLGNQTSWLTMCLTFPVYIIACHILYFPYLYVNGENEFYVEVAFKLITLWVFCVCAELSTSRSSLCRCRWRQSHTWVVLGKRRRKTTTKNNSNCFWAALLIYKGNPFSRTVHSFNIFILFFKYDLY